MPKITLDLTSAEKILDEVYATLGEHKDVVVEVDYDRGRSRNRGPSPERNQQAAIARDLLRMSELLSAAAGEITLKYWEFKGFQDPRDT